MHLRTLLILVVALAAACSDDSGDNVGSAPDDTGSPERDAGVDTASADAPPDVAPDLPAEPGSLVIEPLQLTFEDVRQGESSSRTIAVSNVGGQPLVVGNVVLTEFDRTGDPEFLKGEDWEDSFVVGAGLFREIEVVYEPKDYGVDQGEIEISTNDPDNETVEIRLETVSAYADLQGPQFVRFGEVEVGEEVTKRIILSNRGLDPLTISDVALGGISNAFAVTFEPAAIPPTVLEKDQDFVMDVRYEPLDVDTDRGTITVTSDDPDGETFEIALTGNDPVPCLGINPETLDFGKISPGEDQSEQVVLLNCSRSLELEVTDIALRDDGGGVFSVGDLPDLPLQLVPLETAELAVSGVLADPGVATGELKVTSDDPKSSGQVGLRLTAAEEP